MNYSVFCIIFETNHQLFWYFFGTRSLHMELGLSFLSCSRNFAQV